MITQELIDYVKMQLSSGVTRETITSDLISQGGWTMEQIDEAFQSTSEQSISAQTSFQIQDSHMTQPPKTIKYFEWLMYASLVPLIIFYVFHFRVLLVAIILFEIFLAYRIVYYQNNWARIVLVILSIFRIGSSSIISVFYISHPTFLLQMDSFTLTSILTAILRIIAIYFVFRDPSDMWLGLNTNLQKQHNPLSVTHNDNSKWNKIIPTMNKFFSIIAIGIFLITFFSFGGFDVFSDRTISFFAWGMVAVLFLLIIMNYLENLILVKKYTNSISKLDTWFLIFIIFRNLVLILNVLPYIQIVGMLIFVYTGIPYLVVYFLLVRARNKSVVTI